MLTCCRYASTVVKLNILHRLYCIDPENIFDSISSNILEILKIFLPKKDMIHNVSAFYVKSVQISFRK